MAGTCTVLVAMITHSTVYRPHMMVRSGLHPAWAEALLPPSLNTPPDSQSQRGAACSGRCGSCAPLSPASTRARTRPAMSRCTHPGAPRSHARAIPSARTLSCVHGTPDSAAAAAAAARAAVDRRQESTQLRVREQAARGGTVGNEAELGGGGGAHSLSLEWREAPCPRQPTHPVPR